MEKNGFTLVELLLAMAISGIVMAAVYTAYRSQHKSYVVQEQTITMQQNLRAGLYFLKKGIRMAGFDPNGTFGAAITAAGSNSMSFTRQYTENYRDLNNNGARDPGEDYADYNGNNSWDPDALFTIQYSLVGDALTANIQGTLMNITDSIQAIGFAYAFDGSPQDGQLDTDGGNIIWAIDSDGNGTLDLNLDSNGDGNINAADDTDSNGTINGVAIGGLTATLADIRAVRIWLLARAERPDPDFYNSNVYTVGNQVITPNDNVRREIMVIDIKCRNIGL